MDSNLYQSGFYYGFLNNKFNIMKNRIVLIILALVATFSVFCQSVGINQTGAAPNSSAILDVESTSKGFLPPRMTTEERNAISNPATGLIIFNTTTGSLNYYFSGSWYEVAGILQGSISTLECSSATNSGTLAIGVPATGVNSSIPYTGGNGGNHNGQIVPSTGVTGLTATLAPGTFANGSGTLLYAISGTPATGGTASFVLNIGGQTCILTRTVSAFVCGISTITFITNGVQVTYGTVISANNRCWLDRNLGASQVATSSTDANAYGHYFQWGRLDDGHQVMTSPTTPVQSTGDIPGHGNFITSGSPPYDWRNPQNPSLWQGINGINNPCPSGYRLPTEAEWETERQSWNTNNSAGAFASPLKLALTGLRYHFAGDPLVVGTQGYYWSSSVSGVDSRGLTFEGSNAWMHPFVRSFGIPVRCIKD
jgi:uncharacterized protein (TIGR02145 family)